MSYKILIRAAAACALLGSFAATAIAQGFPVRPVRIIVPVPAGGATDLLGRAIAQGLSERWGQPVLIDHRPGAQQIVGAETTAKAAPDGHTLFLSDSSTFVINPHLYKLPYDPVKDFTPIALVSRSLPVLAVNTGMPVSSIRELIALAKSKPGILSYGTMGTGSYSHIGMEEFGRTAGIQILHVPYKGAAPAAIDLAAGRISMMLVNLSIFDALEKAGKVRILAAGTAKRLLVRPDLPTIAEEGVSGFDLTTWFGIFGPANLPRDMVTKIQADVARAVAQPAVRNQPLITLGFELLEGTSDQLAQMIRTDIERWGERIRQANIKAE